MGTSVTLIVTLRIALDNPAESVASKLTVNEPDWPKAGVQRKLPLTRARPTTGLDGVNVAPEGRLNASRLRESPSGSVAETVNVSRSP